MSSLSAKDRVSLCQFTFADGRRCRTPRTGKNPHFCFDHAQKEARAHAVESLSKDLSYFFSGDYLSACDLSTALGLLLPAVIRGDVKPRTARTVAYLAQTLLQTIRMSQHEYCEAFDPDDWRDSIRNSVNDNYDHRFPPTPESAEPESPQPQPAHPQPQPAQTPVNCRSPLATHHSPLPQAPHTPLPATASEFAQQVMAGLQTGEKSSSPNPQPASPPPQPAASTTNLSPPTPATQPSPQLQPPPEPRPPIAATPSAPWEELRPAAGPQAGPSGLPVLAPLPPRKPGASPVRGSS